MQRYMLLLFVSILFTLQVMLLAFPSGKDNFGEANWLNGLDLQLKDEERLAEELKEAPIRYPSISEINRGNPNLPSSIVEMDIMPSKTGYGLDKRGVDKIRKWNTNVIPYTIRAKTPEVTKTAIKKCMEDIQAKTCIVFVEKPDVKERMEFFQGEGCWSTIGKEPNGLTEVSIGEGCEPHFVAIHELLHGLGFYHEQARPDRDKYVKIFYDNIDESLWGQFDKSDRIKTQGTPYDYTSVMHYFRDEFSKNGKDTVQAMNNPSQPLGNYEGLSTLDVKELNNLFCAHIKDKCKIHPCKCKQGSTGCTAFCKTESGEAKCSCSKGFALSDGNICRDVDECNSKPCDKKNGRCSNTLGSYECGCMPGYKLKDDKKTCTDINECHSFPCDKKNGQCRNTEGSYKCECNKGFKLQDDGKACEDIDECGTSPCDSELGICLNTAGSYQCKCQRGYKVGRDGKTCTDINECKNSPCDKNYGICTNTKGGYQCSCKTGFVSKDDDKTCQDIDECERTPCDYEYGFCKNIPGSFVCSCKKGYEIQQDKSTCVAAKGLCSSSPCKCQKGTSGCFASCTNEGNAFKCSCNSGFKLYGKSLCIAENHCNSNPCKCKEGTPGCSSSCTNEDNGFKCSCNSGFKLDGKSLCIAENHCRSNPCKCRKGTSGCSASCTNEGNNFKCSCNSGFKLDGKSLCIATSHCSSSPCKCQKGTPGCFASCSNEGDDFKCSCSSGFKLIGKSLCVAPPSTGNHCSSRPCTCQEVTVGCYPYCSNDGADFKCSCSNGYKLGDKTLCVDIDECQGTPCDQKHGICKNSQGSYVCGCNEGYVLQQDRKTCQESKKKVTTVAPKVLASISSVACGFSNGPCKWIQSKDDQLNWGLQKAVQTQKEGVLYDHTTGQDYFFFAGNPRKAVEGRATLYSKFFVSDGRTRCFQLYYAIVPRGNCQHKLYVQLTHGNGKSVTLAERFESRESWRELKVNIDVPEKGTFRLNVSAVLKDNNCGGGVAIDDAQIYEGACNIGSKQSDALHCSFERNLCLWQKVLSSGNKGFWYEAKEPIHAVTGYFDKFLLAKRLGSSGATEATIRSAVVSTNQNICLQVYSFLSNVRSGFITVKRIDSVSKESKTLLTLGTNTGDQWRDNQIELSAKKNFFIEVSAIFPSQTNENGQSRTVMAIDDIGVLNTRCPARKDLFFCDFEAGDCGLLKETANVCPWNRIEDLSGNQGFVLSWNLNKCQNTGDDITLGKLSFVTKLGSRGSCLSIKYRISKGTDCPLDFQLRSISQALKRSVSAGKVFKDEVTKPFWVKSRLSIYPHGEAQTRMVFFLRMKKGLCEQMEIDDIQVSTGLCPTA